MQFRDVVRCPPSVPSQRNRYFSRRDLDKCLLYWEGNHPSGLNVDESPVYSQFKSNSKSAITTMHLKISHHEFSRSRYRSLVWWCASATICGASMAWMGATQVGPPSVAEDFSVRLVVAWMGLFIAAGFGVAGLMC